METFIPSITRGIFKNSIIYYLSLPLPFCGQVPPSPIFYQGDFFPSPVMHTGGWRLHPPIKGWWAKPFEVSKLFSTFGDQWTLCPPPWHGYQDPLLQFNGSAPACFPELLNGCWSVKMATTSSLSTIRCQKPTSRCQLMPAQFVEVEVLGGKLKIEGGYISMN